MSAAKRKTPSRKRISRQIRIASGLSPVSMREQRVTRDQLHRARSYLSQAGSVLDTLRTLSREDKGPLEGESGPWSAFECATEQLTLRARVLVNAALVAMNDSAADSEDAEDAHEWKLYEKRHREAEQKVAAETA